MGARSIGRRSSNTTIPNASRRKAAAPVALPKGSAIAEPFAPGGNCTRATAKLICAGAGSTFGGLKSGGAMVGGGCGAARLSAANSAASMGGMGGGGGSSDPEDKEWEAGGGVVAAGSAGFGGVLEVAGAAGAEAAAVGAAAAEAEAAGGVAGGVLEMSERVGLGGSSTSKANRSPRRKVRILVPGVSSKTAVPAPPSIASTLRGGLTPTSTGSPPGKTRRSRLPSRASANLVSGGKSKTTRPKPGWLPTRTLITFGSSALPGAKDAIPRARQIPHTPKKSRADVMGFSGRAGFNARQKPIDIGLIHGCAGHRRAIFQRRPGRFGGVCKRLFCSGRGFRRRVCHSDRRHNVRNTRLDGFQSGHDFADPLAGNILETAGFENARRGGLQNARVLGSKLIRQPVELLAAF